MLVDSLMEGIVVFLVNPLMSTPLMIGIVNDIYIVPVNISYDKVMIIYCVFSHYIVLCYTQLLEGNFHHELMVKLLIPVKDRGVHHILNSGD